MVTEQLLRVPDVAKRLDVHEETVLRWLRSGRLKGFRPGGNKAGWRVDEFDLNAFVEAMKRSADGAPR